MAHSGPQLLGQPPPSLCPPPRRGYLTRTPGLAGHLAPRQFAGFHPEDTQQCLAAAWRGPDGVHALLSPGPWLSGPALARQFGQLARLYYVELVARRWLHWGEPVVWLQHWPARAGVPAWVASGAWAATAATDQFERVWLRAWEWPGPPGPLRRRRWTPAAALAGLDDGGVPG